jgi:hypothetical protein
MLKALSRVALATVVIAGLTGCALVPGGSQPSAPPTATPVAQESGGAVDDRCQGLISAPDYEGLWDGGLEPIEYASYGAGSTVTMSGTALVQSESLICSWSDEAGGPAALMIAMAGGEDGFRRTEAIFGSSSSPYNSVRILDGAFVACRGDGSQSCHWNVLDGSTWISVLLAGLTEEQVFHDGLLMPEPARLVSALAESVRGLDLAKTPAAAQPRNCTAYLNPGNLAAPMGVPAANLSVIPQPSLEESSIDERSPVHGQMMWKYAAELLGYSTCGILVDGHLVAVATIAPAGAWVLEDSAAEQPEIVPITGHGSGVEDCTGEASSRSCTVAFASGNDLLFIQLAASRPDATTVGVKVLVMLA